MEEKVKEVLKDFLLSYESVDDPDLKVIKTGVIKDYMWKDIESKQQAKTVVLYAIVENTRNKHRHVAVLGRNPFKKLSKDAFAVWCGDKELKAKFGLTDYCNFWKKNRDCKHTKFFLHKLKQQYIHTNELKASFEEFVVAIAEREQLKSCSSRQKQQKSCSSRQQEIKTILNLGLPALIVGPTGSGKTYTILKELIEEKKKQKLDFSVINLSSGIEDIDLLAKYIPTPDGKWEVRDGELWKAFKEASQSKKYVIVLEELTRATPKALNMLVKAMDGVGTNYILQNFVTGEEIRVPKNKLQFIATANLGSSYAGTEELDPALMRRFLICRFWDYDKETERSILQKLLKDKTLVNKLLKFAESQRNGYRQGEFPYPLDTGTLRKWVEVKIQLGVSFWNAFEMTALYRLVNRDSCGYPDKEQVESLKKMMSFVELE